MDYVFTLIALDALEVHDPGIQLLLNYVSIQNIYKISKYSM